MRFKAIFAAIALVAAPVGFIPAPAYADGIERPPQPRPRPRPRPRAPAPVPPPPVVHEEARVERETVTLSQSFFASSGGVGADIGTGYVGGSTVIIHGAGSSVSAFAYASASASARSGGRFGGGRRGGGHGCACR